MNEITWTDGARPLACKVCRTSGEGTVVAVIHAREGREIDAVRCGFCASVDLVDEPVKSTPTERELGDYVEVGAGISAIAAAFNGIDPTAVRRFLDVGCGYGFAMDIAKFMYGWAVVGVEPSLLGRRGAAELGLDIRNEFLTADTDLGEPFDLILASEVVEHVSDPHVFLAAVRAHLAPGGLLILTTPAAEVIGSGTSNTADVTALTVMSPGHHTFVASAGALQQLLVDAGFDGVRVTREGWSLCALSRVDGADPAAAAPAESAPAVDIEPYLRHRLEAAPEGSALRVGMATRLFRHLVAQGRLPEAETMTPRLFAAFAERYGVDLDDPEEVVTTPAPWSAVGAVFGLGILELNGREDPKRAADHFDAAARLADYWLTHLDNVDPDTADLRFQGAYHRALAMARFAPEEAARQAMLLDNESDPDRLGTARCRILVDLVAAGHRTGLTDLQRQLDAVAPVMARLDTDEGRMAGLDALYSLGVLHAEAEDESAAQAAFIQCLNLCVSRPLDDAHAEQLAALCRAKLAGSEPPEVAAKPGLAQRLRTAIGRRTGPVTWFVETYWSDTWGTYLDGWVHAAGEVRSIRLEAAGQSIVADVIARTDANTGFSAYMPGHFTFPATLVVSTDAGTATADVDLPARPRPVHPEFPTLTAAKKIRAAMSGAPEGPALALGVRAASHELALQRVENIVGREVTGVDIHPGFGVDVVADVHRLSEHFAAEQFAVVYSESLLEHVVAPWLVAAECAKVLKPGGVVVHVAPWVWPTHSQPNDFWRFSNRGLERLFHASLGFRIVDSGGFGGAVISPTPDWRSSQLRMPTHASPAMSWVVAEKVAEADPVAWPYSESDVAVAEEYPVAGLSDESRLAP